MKTLVVANRQRVRRVDTRWLRECAVLLLGELLGVEDYELGVALVGEREMARINGQFLQHTGSTDVITFGYGEDREARSAPAVSTDAAAPRLHGEIFISVGDAVAQAAAWGTTWQSEVVRYLVHGVLHLQGFDDLEPALRRVMKRRENQLLARLARRFALSALERKTKVAA